MKIAGQSFAYLTQLTQENQGAGATAAQERVAKRAAERAGRIEAARTAQQQQAPQFEATSFKDSFSNQSTRQDTEQSQSSKREALGDRPEKPPQPGQVLNILI